MSDSSHDSEEVIIQYLSTHLPTRTAQLVRDIMERHQGERGFSQPSLYRALHSLERSGRIAKIQNPDLITYGIEESSGTAVYLTLTTFAERKKHLDTVFGLLSSGDKADIKAVLDEIGLYRDRYSLTPAQLDQIVGLLDSGTEIAEAALLILHDYFIVRDIPPADRLRFRNALRSSLVEFHKYTPSSSMMRRRIIQMLGKMGDEAVVSQLLEDARHSDDFESLRNDYLTKYTALVIESHRTELFNLERELRKEGRDREAGCIREIRQYAKEHENDPPDALDPMEGLKGLPKMKRAIKGVRP